MLTCHRGCTPMQRCASSRAYSSTRGSRIRGRERPLAVALDELAVEVQLAAASEVLHDVPVDGAVVRAARDRVAPAEGEVDRAGDLLVEERVLHVPRDA